MTVEVFGERYEIVIAPAREVPNGSWFADPKGRRILVASGTPKSVAGRTAAALATLTELLRRRRHVSGGFGLDDSLHGRRFTPPPTYRDN